MYNIIVRVYEIVARVSLKNTLYLNKTFLTSYLRARVLTSYTHARQGIYTREICTHIRSVSKSVFVYYKKKKKFQVCLPVQTSIRGKKRWTLYNLYVFLFFVTNLSSPLTWNTAGKRKKKPGTRGKKNEKKRNAVFICAHVYKSRISFSKRLNVTAESCVLYLTACIVITIIISDGREENTMHYNIV